MIQSGLKASALALSFLACASMLGHARPTEPRLMEMPVEELKQMYLDCDQLASASMLGFSMAIECSMVSEELLRRAFDGSFEQLMQWWRKARSQCDPATDCDS